MKCSYCERTECGLGFIVMREWMGKLVYVTVYKSHCAMHAEQARRDVVAEGERQIKLTGGNPVAGDGGGSIPTKMEASSQ